MDERIADEFLKGTRYEKNGDRDTSSASNMEQIDRNESVATEKDAGFNTQVCIHIHSIRYRLADVDGISAKAAIDGIVKAGILANDTTKEIREIKYTQELVRKPAGEKTVITIVEVND